MRQDAKKIFKISLISLFFIFIIAFALFNSRDLIFGVKIKDVNIIDNTKVLDSVFVVTGVAKHAVKLTLNDREIFIDDKGNFAETIALHPGYNIVSIKAQDKFGNYNEKNYKLIYSTDLEY